MEHKPSEKIEHMLALRVMRLAKPTLSSPLVITNETKDLPEDILNNDLKNDITSVEGSETLAVGQFLLTPQSFETIHLGESFLSYIFLHNDSSHVAKNVTLKADLQSVNQRINLKEYSTSELGPENSIDLVIHREVEEIGTHILICDVSYISPEGRSLHFVKQFPFQVFNSLGVKTKFYNAESNEVILEAVLQNETLRPINLEKVSLISSKMYKVTSLNNSEEEEPGGGLLQPGTSRQYLYCFDPVFNTDKGNSLAVSNVGVLEICWRCNLGERGRLQTSQLQTKGPDFGDIRLSIHNLPNIVKIEEPFTFKCRILNLSKRSMNLSLGLAKAYPDLLWIGTSGRRVGRIEVGCSTVVELTLVPLSAGLHNISGIRLKDSFSNRSYDFDEVAQVFVI